VTGRIPGIDGMAKTAFALALALAGAAQAFQPYGLSGGSVAARARSACPALRMCEDGSKKPTDGMMQRVSFPCPCTACCLKPHAHQGVLLCSPSWTI